MINVFNSIVCNSGNFICFSADKITNYSVLKCALVALTGAALFFPRPPDCSSEECQDERLWRLGCLFTAAILGFSGVALQELPQNSPLKFRVSCLVLGLSICIPFQLWAIIR